MKKLGLPKINDNLLLRDRAYEVIKEAITTGQFKPGQELTEQVLSEELGISKTPIRDALRQLQGEGFVKIHPFKGAEVSGIDSREIAEILELRSLLEPYAASVAAARMSEADLEILRRIVAAMVEESQKGKFRPASKLHRDFHLLISSKVENQRFQQIIENLNEHVDRFIVGSMKVPSNVESAIGEYEAIIAALEKRDPSLAAQAMKAHIQNVSFRFEEGHLVQGGDYETAEMGRGPDRL